MINVVDDVINTLRADTVLTGLLQGQFVYWQKPSLQSSSYILIKEISNSESDSADDEEYADDIEIQADIYTKGSTIPIANQLQKAMRKKGYTHQAMPDNYDKKTEIYHKPIRFFIKVEI